MFFIRYLWDILVFPFLLFYIITNEPFLEVVFRVGSINICDTTQTKSMEKFNDFETFVQTLNESSARELAIRTAVDKLKKRYGDTNDKFLESVTEKGVDEIKDYIIGILVPFMNDIESQEKESNGQLRFDFDGLLAGLVSRSLVDLELQIIKKQKP